MGASVIARSVATKQSPCCHSGIGTPPMAARDDDCVMARDDKRADLMI